MTLWKGIQGGGFSPGFGGSGAARELQFHPWGWIRAGSGHGAGMRMEEPRCGHSWRCPFHPGILEKQDMDQPAWLCVPVSPKATSGGAGSSTSTPRGELIPKGNVGAETRLCNPREGGKGAGQTAPGRDPCSSQGKIGMGSDGWGQPLQNIPLEVVLGFWEGLGKQQEPEGRGIVELGSALRCGAVCEPGKASWKGILEKGSWKRDTGNMALEKGCWERILQKGSWERDLGKRILAK